MACLSYAHRSHPMRPSPRVRGGGRVLSANRSVHPLLCPMALCPTCIRPILLSHAQRPALDLQPPCERPPRPHGEPRGEPAATRAGPVIPPAAPQTASDHRGASDTPRPLHPAARARSSTPHATRRQTTSYRMTQDLPFFFLIVGGHSTTRIASSKTCLSPFCVNAEHSKYLIAPMLLD